MKCNAGRRCAMQRAGCELSLAWGTSEYSNSMNMRPQQDRWLLGWEAPRAPI